MARVALVGYGYWGPKLAARVVASGEGATLAAICEQAPDRAAEAKAAYPEVAVHTGVERVLADPGVDAVILATPTASHGPLARLALERGKHVLVEKPMALSSADAMALTEMSELNGLVLMVDHTYLFSPPLESIQKLVKERGLGPLRYYHSVRSNCFGPRHEINVLWDLAVHDLSILDALMATPPERVQVAGLGDSPGVPSSHAQMMLAYPNRSFASVLVSWIAPAKVRTVMLGFDRHTIAWDDLVSGSSVQLFDRGIEATPDPFDRREIHTVMENIPVSGPEPLANVVRHFLDCIAGSCTPRNGASSGVRTLRVLEAADRSLAEGGSPVSLEMALSAS